MIDYDWMQLLNLGAIIIKKGQVNEVLSLILGFMTCKAIGPRDVKFNIIFC
jgi:hypothetical protein